MSKEIIDLEEDRTFNSIKTIKEKDMMIEELNKKIRFLRFEHEKKMKDLENEILIAQEKLKNSEQNSKISTYEQLLEEMEKNLTNTENELLKSREIESDLTKQAYNLKSENANLRKELEKLTKNAEESSKELEELKQLRQNFDEIQSKIKESAVEAIIEKENELISFREKYSELEAESSAKIDSLNGEINKLQEKLFKSGVFLRDSSEVSFEPSEVDRLREENEKLKRDFEIERADLTERIEILTSELEKELIAFEQSKQFLEKEINEKAYQKLKEQLEASSKSEYNLIEELQKYDEQLKSYENQVKDYEKRLSSQEEKHNKALEFYKRKVEDLERNLLAQREEKKTQSKLEAQYNELLQEFEAKSKENSNVIKSLEKLKEKDMQRILQLEGENKKLSQNIDKLKLSILNLETSKAEIEEKIKSIIQDYEERLSEVSMQRERAKSELKYQKEVRPSNIYKISEENIANLGADLGKTFEDSNNPRPSFNILSPRPSNLLSNELKDFNCEENWQQTDLKELMLEMASAKAAGKKKFEFPTIKITDFERTPAEKTEPIVEKTPKLSISLAESEKISKLEKKLSDLDDENLSLKAEIRELKENLYQEIEKNRVKAAELTKQSQTHRRQTLEGLRLLPAALLENIQTQNQGQGLDNIEKAIQQLENLSREKKEIEGNYLKLKREYEDEKKFLEEELKHTEEAAIEAKLQFAIIATEKDYFEHEHKVIIQELKRKKINIDYDEKKKDLGLLSMFMCNCKS